MSPSNSGFGKTFSRHAGNPLLSIKDCDPWNGNGDPLRTVPSAVHPSVVYFPKGLDGYRFWMVFTPLSTEAKDVVPTGLSAPAPIPSMVADWWWERSTLVRSNDGIHWEKTEDYTNPLISPGASGSWDEGWHCDPDVVYTQDRGPDGGARWFLYYCGCGKRPSYGSSIGLAVSDDGLHYTKVGEDGPRKGHVFTGDHWNSRCPAVVYDDQCGKFHMWHNWGLYEIGYATSDDGVNWQPYNPDTPGEWGHVVLRPTPGTFDGYGITHQDVIRFDGQYWMYYQALPTPEYAGLLLGLATSPDGVEWTKHEEPVLVPGDDLWESGSLYHASPVIVEDSMYFYYGGIDVYKLWPFAGGHCEIGLAFSTVL
jgi:predicted GH43/DUF377 family glycosyl hydrolase